MGNTASTPPVTSSSGGGKSSSRSGGGSSSRRKSSGSSSHRDRDSSDRHHHSSSHRRHASEGEKGNSSNALENGGGGIHSSLSPPTTAEEVAARAQQVVGESVQTLHKGFKKSIRKLEDQDHPAAHFLDTVCGAYMDDTKSYGDHHHRSSSRHRDRGMMGGDSFYSDDCSDDDDDDDDEERTLSEDETTTTTDYHHHRSSSSKHHDRGRSRQRHSSRHNDDPSEAETASFVESDYESEDRRPSSSSHHHHHRSSKEGKSSSRSSSRRGGDDEKSPSRSFESEDDPFQRRGGGGGIDNETITEAGIVTQMEDAMGGTAASSTLGGSMTTATTGLSKPLASSFAKRCYFTKSGIGKTTQHYEGLTLTGNVVLMLAAAMKLKGCPTICDEDLRRVEQTYPNQFSRLPDELLLSSGWRRISKYCHFSHKPIPDGIPFFHSKQRLHPTGGYFFLLAAAVGMVRPIDVEPLTRDTLVLLETDFPAACDAAPAVLIQDPDQWTLVDKFCFFSGGPINTDEDVYYQADFDGNPIYMLAFLSPSLTPAELYKLDPLSPAPQDEPPALKKVSVVEEVESVYDLTERDFDDLKLYHLGPCRALPQYILQPSAWTKVLPPPFLMAREQALFRAEHYEMQQQQQLDAAMPTHDGSPPGISASEYEEQVSHYRSIGSTRLEHDGEPPIYHHLREQQPQSHGAYNNGYQPPLPRYSVEDEHDPMAPMDETAATSAMRINNGGAMDPPEDEPPSLSKRDAVAGSISQEPMHTFSSVEPNNEAYYNDVQGEYDEHGEYYSVSSPDRMASATSEDYIEQGASGDPDYDDDQHHEQGGSGDPDYDHHHQQYSDHDQGESADYDDREAEYHQDEEEYHDDDEYHHQQMSSDYQESTEDDEYHHENNGGVGMEDYHRRHDEEYHESGSDPADQEYQELAVTSSDYNHENEPDPGNSQGEEYVDDDADMDQEHDDDGYHEMGGGGSDYHEENMDEYHYAQDTRVNNYYSTSETIQEEPGGGRDELFPAEENAPREDAPVAMAPRRIDTLMDASSQQMRKSELPPTSPASVQSSEYSHTSSAMRGAQELLKRNRQRRALRKNNNTTNEVKEETIEEPTDAISPKYNAISPRSEVSGGTWESGSEITSVVSGVSSVWTDSSNNPDRSSRRALILQMAKARMKSNKGTLGGAADEAAIMRGSAGVTTSSPAAGGFSPRDSSDDGEDFDGEEEKKLENLSESATDIDIAGDLD